MKSAPPPMDYTSFSVRVWKEQLEFLKKAARAESERRGREITVAEFARLHVLPAAAKVLGVQLPDWPPFIRGKRPGDENITKLAKEMGIPVKDLKKAWLEKLAEQVSKKFLADDEEPASDRQQPLKSGLTPPPFPKAQDVRHMPPIIRKRQTR